MKITGKRIFSIVMLAGTVVSTYQILSKPQPVAAPVTQPEAQAAAQSFEEKLQQLEAPRTEDSAPAELHFTSDEIDAEIARSTAAEASNPAMPRSPDSPIGQGSVQIKSSQVKLEGDVARGQFVARITGADVYVTLAGHLGCKDGYVTFDPTEFKIGELSIPVSLLNSALQKKLAEQREQMKLPPGIAGLRVEDGELVITQK